MNTIIPSPTYISFPIEILPITWIIIGVFIMLYLGIRFFSQIGEGITHNKNHPQSVVRDYKKELRELTGEPREQLSKMSLLLREYLEENNILTHATKKTPHEISYLSKKKELDSLMLQIEEYIYTEKGINISVVSNIKERSIEIINQ